MKQAALKRLRPALLAAAALAFSTTAIAAADPAVICEASKLSMAAKYGSCRLKAESKAVKTATTPDYSKCSLAKFADADTKADGSCPSMGDESTVTTYMNSCANRVTTWLDGGGGLPDTCETDLAECDSDLTTCDSDLTACDSDLTACDGDLADCEADAHGQVPKTGATICYNTGGTVIPCAGTGQDGETQRGIARSYTDNGDGTITDNNTGLMWEKLDDSNLVGVAGIHDKDNFYTWANAFVKANDLNTISFAGYTDWRVPNAMELQSIVNFGTANPSVNSTFNTACAPGCTVTTCSCTKPLSYWSSNTYQGGASFAWLVYFDFGFAVSTDKANGHYVRAVRAGS